MYFNYKYIIVQYASFALSDAPPPVVYYGSAWPLIQPLILKNKEKQADNLVAARMSSMEYSHT